MKSQHSCLYCYGNIPSELILRTLISWNDVDSLQYKADQEAIARSYQENIQSLAPVIEDALFDELKSLPHEELKDLSPAMRAAVVDRALKKVWSSLVSRDHPSRLYIKGASK